MKSDALGSGHHPSFPIAEEDGNATVARHGHRRVLHANLDPRATKDDPDLERIPGAGHPRIEPKPIAVEQDGRSWLVAPYGAVSWVHNAGAAGRVGIRRGRGSFDYSVREVGPDEAAPILKRYVGIASATRPYFQASKDSPVDVFRAEAHRHPVFELTVVDAETP